MSKFLFSCISHPKITAGPLLKDPSAWRLIMDWAQDKIGYVDFDNKVREFGLRYIYQEWKPLIDAIFAASDPSNEDAQQPLAIVEEAMRTYSVSFAASANPLTNPPTQIDSSRSVVRRLASGSSTRKRKRRKTHVSAFLDLTAGDEDNGEVEEDDGDSEEGGEHVWGSPDSCIRTSGKETFTRAIDAVVARYGGASHPQDTRPHKLPQIPEGIPRPLNERVYIVDFFSGTFTRLQQCDL